MSKEQETKFPSITLDWEYKVQNNVAKKDSSVLEVCVPYIGTYGGLDASVDSYLYDTHYDDIRTYVPDMGAYDEIAITYNVDLGAYNEAYIEEIKDILELKELHLVLMHSPREYNFATDKLVAQIHKDELWKLYESVKDTDYYKNEVHDATTPREGYMPWYDEDDFFFSSKEDWSDDYDRPAILELILKAAVHEKLELNADDSVEMELFMRQEDNDSITSYISIDSIKTYKNGKKTEVEL